MNESDTTDAGRSCDSNNMVDFIHIHTLNNILFLTVAKYIQIQM